MERTERFYRIDDLLKTYRAVSKQKLLEDLEISAATFKRDLEYLRSRMGAPIEFDRSLGGYRYLRNEEGCIEFELPGLWFNAEELHALLTAEALLAGLAEGFLSKHIEPIRARIVTLLEEGEHTSDELRKRIRLLPQAARHTDERVFQRIATALLQRRRLCFDHYNRRRDETTERTVSPQRLVHYRDNWYLDTWCHLRNDLRSFSLDVVSNVRVVERKARDVSDRQLDKTFAAGYGIFGGNATEIATLKFSPERARWVRSEHWHPEQQGDPQLDGTYLLKLPYSNQTELVMDILRHGQHVEVLGPASLRKAVQMELQAALAQYPGGY